MAENKYIKTQKDALLIEVLKENLLQKNRLLLGLNNYLKIEEIKSIIDWFNLERLILIFPRNTFCWYFALPTAYFSRTKTTL